MTHPTPEGTPATAGPSSARIGAPGRPGAPRPAGPALALEIIDALRAFSTEMDRYIDTRGGAVGLHRTDLNALAHVLDARRTGGDLSPGELAHRLSLSPPATSALLRRLESVGHVRRTHSEVDRRRVAVEMTDEAMGVAAGIFGPIATTMRETIASYSLAERETVLRFLTDAVDAAERATNAGDDEESGNGLTTPVVDHDS
ncbi:MarR family winged helix-turn-helix transcriptional regulator [Pedococcus soli]